jgi:hypothetical protein
VSGQEKEVCIESCVKCRVPAVGCLSIKHWL